MNSPDFEMKTPREATRGTFASNAQGRYYGFKTFSDYFTPRQLVALATFFGLLKEVRERVAQDGASAEYAGSIVTYLALAIDKGANLWSSLSGWMSDRGAMRMKPFVEREIEASCKVVAWPSMASEAFDLTGS